MASHAFNPRLSYQDLPLPGGMLSRLLGGYAFLYVTVSQFPQNLILALVSILYYTAACQ